MPKKNIHPDYHNISVTATNGQVFQTRSTYGKEGASLRLDVDPHNHPAWTGNFVVRNVGRAATFNQKYSAWAKATEKKES